MNVLLINMCLRYDSPLKLLPVGLACIATALRDAGFKPDILDIDLYRYSDKEVTNFLEKNKYDIIGLGNIVSAYRYTKKISSLVKQVQPDTTMVVGNTVASIPVKLLEWNPQIDIAVIGEGDRTIVDIVRAKKEKRPYGEVNGIAYRANREIHVTPKRNPIPKMEDIPFPDFSLFEIDKYVNESYKMVSEPHPIPREELKNLPFNTARGCPYNCTFCSHAFKDARYRYYPFKMVVEEFKRLQTEHGIKYLNFWDELTFVSKKRVVEFCEELEKEKLEVYWPIGPRGNLFTKKDLDLLKRCKDNGALTIGGALESADPDILKAMNKKITVSEFVEQMETARAAGLIPGTSLVFGYPQETKESIRKTLDVCKHLGMYPSVGFVLPLPNTPIYEYARQNGYIEDEEAYLLRIADRQDLHVNLTSLEDEELYETVKEGLVKLKNDLQIPLDDDKVIKTTIYKASRKNQN